MNIILTGASSGLGATLRACLLDQGHKVFGVGLHGPDFHTDFSTGVFMGNRVWVDIFNEAEDEMGGTADCLVNNAGITHIAYAEAQSWELFRRVMQVNLEVPFALSREMIHRHYDGKPFRIVNNCSMAARMSMRCSPAYCASKAGLESLTKQMAKELAGRRYALVIGISPGAIDHTDMLQQAKDSLVSVRGFSPEKAAEYVVGASPFNRAMAHSEAWKVFDFAINQAPEYMSGSIIPIPGAMGI